MSYKNPSLSRIYVAVGIIMLVVIGDQVSKTWILHGLMSPPRVVSVLPFIDFVLTWNSGVGFGLLKTHSFWGTAALILMTFGISVGLGIWVWRTTDKLLLVSLSLIIGGAVGNLIDRVQFGAVLDFIYVHIYFFDYHFPAFNVADSMITIGAMVLLLDEWRKGKK